MTARTVAIVGGGPAGLSLARLLAERGVSATVFEADERVGGKSQSTNFAGAVHELGTCYSTLAHNVTNRWMRQLGVRQATLGTQLMDGAPFFTYVKSGPGQSLSKEGMRYLKLWRAHDRAMAAHPDEAATRAEAAMPVADWLERHDFERVRKLMLRSVTTMGYGYLDAVTTCQALRWTTPNLILTGMLNRLKMPVIGWQGFWERVASELDVRLAAPVIELDRTGARVSVTTPHGVSHFDEVVITTPMDEMSRFAKANADEQYIAEAAPWGRLAVTLIDAADWYKKAETWSYSDALEAGAPAGLVLSSRRARLTARRPEDAQLYVTYQYGDLPPEALLERLKDRLHTDGARLRAPILQKVWKYFPRYQSQAVADGLITRMHAMQGRARTWYSGATFSHEAVSNIVAFNVALADRIAAAKADRASAAA